MSILKIDLDVRMDRWKDILKEYIEVCKFILENYYNLKVKKIIVRNTARGHHIWIHLNNNLDDATINKLQFVLGDDRTRWKINQMRVERNTKRWNILFTKVLWQKVITEPCKSCKLRKLIIESSNKNINKKIAEIIY